MDSEELDARLRREFGLPPRSVVKEVLDRIVHPLPPHLAALVAKVNRTKPGSALFPLGGGPGLLELQDQLDRTSKKHSRPRPRAARAGHPVPRRPPVLDARRPPP